jgi:hypothetical protein
MHVLSIHSGKTFVQGVEPQAINIIEVHGLLSVFGLAFVLFAIAALLSIYSFAFFVA